MWPQHCRANVRRTTNCKQPSVAWPILCSVGSVRHKALTMYMGSCLSAHVGRRQPDYQHIQDNASCMRCLARCLCVVCAHDAIAIIILILTACKRQATQAQSQSSIALPMQVVIVHMRCVHLVPSDQRAHKQDACLTPCPSQR